MSTLRVDLQEGFKDDAVDLRVNGQDGFQKEGVTTKLLLGLASSAEIEVPNGTVTIEIKVPTKNLAKTISLEVPSAKYLGISIANGKIEHIVSHEPFGYA